MPPRPTRAACCATLEVDPAAGPEEVRRGYQRMVLLWHPDRFEPGTPLWTEAQARIQAINEAYGFLRAHPEPAPAPEAPGPAAPRPAPRPPRAGRPRSGLVWLAAAAGGMTLLALLAWPRPAAPPAATTEAAPAPARPAPAEPGPVPAAPRTPALEVDQPALVIFWPSGEELQAATPARRDEVARFLETAQEVRERVQKLRPNLPVLLTDADTIRVQGTEVRRALTCGFGYLVYAPPRRQLVLQGLQNTGKLIELISESFPSQDGRTEIHPAP